jgi:exopolyphosphatase/guanosine-5'-triphosphate,3'-diphosphate pyrophosphatase
MTCRVAAADALLVQFGWEPEHSRHVRDLAVGLFNELRPLHGFGDAERDLLEAAALLHDIGWTVTGQKHHKHAYRLIREHGDRLVGFTSREVELVANVARYHRKALPSPDHEAFASLPVSDQGIVTRLSALLRLADGLDRPHRQAVRIVRGAVAADRVTIALQVVTDPADHLNGAARKQDLFVAAFGRTIEFVCQ